MNDLTKVEHFLNIFSHYMDLNHQEISELEIPTPFSDLLAHNHYMTSTLEDHYQSTILLKVLERKCEECLYARNAILTLENGKVIEFAILCVHFQNCEKDIRKEVLEEKTPLGKILENKGISKEIRPYVFFTTYDNPGNFLCKSDEMPFFGRLASIYYQDKPLVQVMEILSH